MAGIGFPIGGQDPSGDDWASKAPLFAEIEKLMQWSGGPVNWDLARQVAVRAAAEGDARVTSDESAAARDAVRLADLWLEDATALPSGLTADGEAWNRVRWVEATLPVWQQLIDPVAARVVDGLGGALTSGLGEISEHGLPEEIAGQLPPGMADMLPKDPAALNAMLSPMLGMIGQLGGVLFGTQVGQALGALAGSVVAAGEVGLPLAPAGHAALLPANVAAFAADVDADLDQVRLYLALREAAALRLFAHVPWLRSGLLGAVEEYARGIQVDPEQLQQSIGSLGGLGGIDPNDPEALQQALGEDLFSVKNSPEQERALARLEALLALVEGWIDLVVAAAAAPRLPAATALREAVRRKRVSGGPAEQTFSALVGLQLRPRRLAEAATVWDGLTVARGIDERDALWEHPDLLPSAEDLDDPTAFVLREDVVGDDPVAAIEALMATGQRGPVEDDAGGVRERGEAAEVDVEWTGSADTDSGTDADADDAGDTTDEPRDGSGDGPTDGPPDDPTDR